MYRLLPFLLYSSAGQTTPPSFAPSWGNLFSFPSCRCIMAATPTLVSGWQGSKAYGWVSDTSTTSNTYQDFRSRPR